MSRLDQIRRMSDDDLILFLRRYKSEKEGYVILGLEPCAIGEIRESRRMLQGRSEEVPVYDRK